MGNSFSLTPQAWQNLWHDSANHFGKGHLSPIKLSMSIIGFLHMHLQDVYRHILKLDKGIVCLYMVGDVGNKRGHKFVRIFGNCSGPLE